MKQAYEKIDNYGEEISEAWGRIEEFQNKLSYKQYTNSGEVANCEQLFVSAQDLFDDLDVAVANVDSLVARMEGVMDELFEAIEEE